RPALIAHGGEADPPRVVRMHRVAVEDWREQTAYLRDAGDIALAGLEPARREGFEAGAAPHRVVHLHDERAPGRVVRVTVNLHDAVRRLDDVELERIEDEVRPEPHELAAAHLESRLKRPRVPAPYRRVDAVRADHQVVRHRELTGG